MSYDSNMNTVENIGYLYINGRNDGSVKTKDKLAHWWWKQAGLELHHAQINWFEGSLDEKIEIIEWQARELLGRFGHAALIGASAGTSLALNTFYERLREDSVCVVAAHGRVRAGDYPKENKNSLYQRAFADVGHASQAFYDSVTRAENEVLPNLSAEDKRRVLVLTQLTDLIAPLETCMIDGVQQHRSLALGHSGGSIAHMFADRDLIINFASEALSR